MNLYYIEIIDFILDWNADGISGNVADCSA